jgi:hypothetical protein
LPSHNPLVEQAVLPKSWQVFRGSGAPLATFKHRPGELGKLQLWQVPAQLFSQHTPSTHWPETHSLALAQSCPFCFLPQEPVVTPFTVCSTHWFPGAQSESSVQICVHATPVQRKGEQSTSWDARQVPLPSQVRGVFSIRPEQEDGSHTVSFG